MASRRTDVRPLNGARPLRLTVAHAAAFALDPTLAARRAAFERYFARFRFRGFGARRTRSATSRFTLECGKREVSPKQLSHENAGHRMP